MQLTPEFVTHFSTVFDEGTAWLAELPQRIAHYERMWGIRVGEPFELSYNVVARATQMDGTEVVLKMGVPRGELTREIAAVKLHDGHGMARLLEADAENGAMLLERLKPGAMLSTLEDDEMATRIAAEVMRKLFISSVPAGHPFRPVLAWADGLGRLRAEFDGGTGVFDRRLVEQAETFFAELLGTASETVLIHGDLHHFNILQSGDGWLAIDPKGMTGEPAYEIGAFLRNPIGVWNRPKPIETQARRIAIFSEMLDIDRQKITRYALAQAVLSAWWTYEDEGVYAADMMTCADHFAALL